MSIKNAIGSYVLLTSVMVSSSGAPLRPHPDNPHYFLYKGKPTVLITSEESYGAVVNRDFDYVPYLDKLAQYGFNKTRAFSGTYHETGSWGTTLTTHGPNQYVTPFLYTDMDGGSERRLFDLDRWNTDYFDRLKDFVKKADERGIVVELNLFCTMYHPEEWKIAPHHPDNNVQSVNFPGGGGYPKGDEDYNIADNTRYLSLDKPDLVERQKKVAIKIVQELGGFDNVYYEIANEPFVKKHPVADMVAWHDAIIDAIKPHLSGHVIAVNYHRNWAMDHLHGGVSILNRHYVGNIGSTGLFGSFDLLDNHYYRNMPLAFAETCHIGGGPWPPNTMTPAEGRVEAGEYIVGGGSVYSNFNFTYQDDNELGEGPDSNEFRDYLGKLVQFINGFDLATTEKYDGVSATFTGKPPEERVRAIREGSKRYAIYVHHSEWSADPNPSWNLHYKLNSGSYTATLTLDDLPAGDYTVQWVRPTDSVVLRTDTITDHPGGSKQLQPSPGYSIDIAVRILRILR